MFGTRPDSVMTSEFEPRPKQMMARESIKPRLAWVRAHMVRLVVAREFMPRPVQVMTREFKLRPGQVMPREFEPRRSKVATRESELRY